MEQPEGEIMINEQFRERFTLSPTEIRRNKEKMIFYSIRFPGRMIRKRAYIYELLTDQNHYSIKKISRFAQCGISKIYRVKEMIASNYPESAYYEEPERGRPVRMDRNVKEQLILRSSGKLSDAKLAQELSREFHLQKALSRSLINLYRKRFGFRFKPPKQRQRLTEGHT